MLPERQHGDFDGNGRRFSHTFHDALQQRFHLGGIHHIDFVPVELLKLKDHLVGGVFDLPKEVENYFFIHLLEEVFKRHIFWMTIWVIIRDIIFMVGIPENWTYRKTSQCFHWR